MSADDSTPVVACTLTEEGERTRSEHVRSALGSNYVGFEERADGYGLRFGGTDETLQSVARFVADELRCCSFADYTIDVSPPYQETRLIVAGPEGTKAMFRQGLVDRLEVAQS